MRDEGILTALKHFPGHGSSFADSHRGFVDVTDTAKPGLELLPYRTLIAEGTGGSVMTAHVLNRRARPPPSRHAVPPTIDGLLRGKLGFHGLVVSDDLRMGAIEQYYGLGEAAVRALAAGVDVLLIADDRLPDGRSATRSRWPPSARRWPRAAGRRPRRIRARPSGRAQGPAARSRSALKRCALPIAGHTNSCTLARIWRR